MTICNLRKDVFIVNYIVFLFCFVLFLLSVYSIFFFLLLTAVSNCLHSYLFLCSRFEIDFSFFRSCDDEFCFCNFYFWFVLISYFVIKHAHLNFNTFKTETNQTKLYIQNCELRLIYSADGNFIDISNPLKDCIELD